MVGARYELEALIAKGGMGEVHRARDHRRQRACALKLLPRPPAKDTRSTALRLTMFEREYHVLRQLKHPRIVAVDDYGIDEHSN